MPKCQNRSCTSANGKRASIPKGVFPPLCGEDCKEAWVKQVMDECNAKAERAMRKARNWKAREEKEARKEARRKRSDYWAGQLSHQLELTQRVFNRMIRLLDRGGFCPTCGEPLVDGEYDAGHARTVASCSQLRYEARACFGQCRKCNGSGTIRKRTRKTQEVVSELYKAWILETFGWQRHAWLYGPHDSHDWTCEELVELRKVFAAECHRLEQGLAPSKDWRSVPRSEEDAAA